MVVAAGVIPSLDDTKFQLSSRAVYLLYCQLDQLTEIT